MNVRKQFKKNLTFIVLMIVIAWCALVLYLLSIV